MRKNKVSFFVSSDSKNGATNINSNNSKFTVELSDPLQIPSKAMNCELIVNDAAIFNSVPNIITGTNDKFYIDAPNTSDVITSYTITLDEGSYTLASLEEAIQADLESAGAKISDGSVISFSDDDAQQKVILNFTYASTVVDFTQADSFATMFGADSATYTAAAGASVTMPNRAKFNALNAFHINTDLVSKGMRINGSYRQTIASIPITEAPNDQIYYEPIRPHHIGANKNIGRILHRFTVWITDELGNDIDMTAEEWHFTMVLSWEEI